MRIVLAVALGIAVPVAVLAAPEPAEWAPVTVSRDSTAVMFVDMRSIAPRADGMKMTRQAMVVVPEMNGVAAMTATVLVDCPGRRMIKSTIQAYRSDGSLIVDRPANDEWQYAKEGSVNESVVDFVCADTPKETAPRSTEKVPIVAGRKLIAEAKS